MFRFLFGAALASSMFLLLSTHPEWFRRAIAVGRAQLGVAARNVTAATSSARRYQPEDRPTTIDYARVRALVPSMKSLSSDQLWQVMGDDDYDRRSAAGQILLARAGIPVSAEGIDVVRRK